MSPSDTAAIKGLSYRDGQVIFKEGEPGDHAYVVDNGLVEISKDAHGEKVVLGTIGDGGMFGEMALIDNAPRMATATAKGDVDCLIISKRELQKNLEGANPFLILLVHMLIKNIRSVSDNYVDFVADTRKTPKPPLSG